MKVLCIMLAAGRQQMVDRAVRCFQAQTYPERVLYVLDNGEVPVSVPQGSQIKYGCTDSGKPIGTLRNLANSMSIPLECDIIAHWDSDDWSHPERLSEQVRMLEKSGKQAVGYRECLFWNTCPGHIKCAGHFCGAWFYSNPNPGYAIGSSLLYWRKAWEKRPFPDKMAGEDTEWVMGVKCAGEPIFEADPKMICAIHGGNTTSKIIPTAKEWRRVPQWDAICRERMAL